jgi:hypothetical protein
VHMIYETLLR